MQFYYNAVLVYFFIEIRFRLLNSFLHNPFAAVYKTEKLEILQESAFTRTKLNQILSQWHLAGIVTGYKDY